MKTILCTLPDSLYAKLAARAKDERVAIDHLISSLLAQGTETPLHTLFQVSTSSALVEGLYQGAVRVGQLLEHGDFGLGTFVDLNGEMIVLDGACYQMEANGTVTRVEDERCIPYAVVTRFSADFSHPSHALTELGALIEACDSFRQSDNIFYAFRVEGTFTSIKTRIMRPVAHGTLLKDAAGEQAEFSLQSEAGTLVGIWAPAYAGSFIVPGYHFHFLSQDCERGGHVLECVAAEVTITGCAMNAMHVSLPETEAFLKADLTRDPSEDLRDAEQKH